MKLFIVGRGGSGKDHVASRIESYMGWTFESSSYFMLFDVWKDIGNGEDIIDFYEDRRNRRAEWQAAIKRFNQPLDRLTRKIFAKYNMYVGIRDREEFLASRHHGDLSIWIDADRREPSDDPMTILPGDCDITIDNNGSEFELELKIQKLCLIWRGL